LIEYKAGDEEDEDGRIEEEEDGDENEIKVVVEWL
jgi:hypothetical protein